MWEKIGLSKPYNKSLWLGQLWEEQLFDILTMVDSGELMLRLVVYEGDCVLCGDIFLETNSYLYCIWVHCFGSTIQLVW